MLDDMVELDNYDCTNHPGIQYPNDTYHPYGYDEISWYAHQPESYRNSWVQYVVTWLVSNDNAGHLEMPEIRVLCAPTTQPNSTFMTHLRMKFMVLLKRTQLPPFGLHKTRLINIDYNNSLRINTTNYPCT